MTQTLSTNPSQGPAEVEASFAGIKPDFRGSGCIPAIGTGSAVSSSCSTDEGYQLGGLYTALTGRALGAGGVDLSKEVLDRETQRLLGEVGRVSKLRPELGKEVGVIVEQTAKNLRTSIDVALFQIRDLLKSSPQTSLPTTPKPTSSTTPHPSHSSPSIPQPSLLNLPATPHSTSSSTSPKPPTPLIPQPSLINVPLPTTRAEPSIAAQLDSVTKGGVRRSGSIGGLKDLVAGEKDYAVEAVDHLSSALKKVVSAVDALQAK